MHWQICSIMQLATALIILGNSLNVLFLCSFKKYNITHIHTCIHTYIHALVRESYPTRRTREAITAEIILRNIRKRFRNMTGIIWLQGQDYMLSTFTIIKNYRFVIVIDTFLNNLAYQL